MKLKEHKTKVSQHSDVSELAIPEHPVGYVFNRWDVQSVYWINHRTQILIWSAKTYGKWPLENWDNDSILRNELFFKKYGHDPVWILSRNISFDLNRMVSITVSGCYWKWVTCMKHGEISWDVRQGVHPLTPDSRRSVRLTWNQPEQLFPLWRFRTHIGLWKWTHCSETKLLEYEKCSTGLKYPGH